MFKLALKKFYVKFAKHARTKVTARDLFASPANFFALGFGAGLIGFAPGTWGTVAALPIFFLVQPHGAVFYFGFIVVAVAGGVHVCSRAAKFLKQNDHPAIVWDEIAGLLVALYPAATAAEAVLGAVLFRVFDVVKPWPVNKCERIPGGVGIMADDLLAGIFANVALRILSPVLAPLLG